MIPFISLIRGINVGGHKKITGDALRALYEGFGFEKVQIYIQSGNVVFQAIESDALLMESKIEAEIERVFGFSVRVFLRTTQEWASILKKNPFLKDRKIEETKLHVTFLSEAPSEIAMKEWGKVKDPVDETVVVGREIFIFCPNGYGHTRFSNAFLEKKLKVSGTTRNWKTVQTLAEMATQSMI